MTPDCSKAQSYLDRQLSSDEAAAFEKHASTCADCGGQVRSWQGFLNAFRPETEQLMAPPTQGDENRLIAKAEAARHSRRPLRRASWALALAGAAVAVVGMAVVWSRGQTTISAFAIDEAGQRTPVRGGVLEAEPDRRTRFALGEDRIGLAAGSRVTLARRDSNSVRLKLERGTVAASVSHRALGQTFSVEVRDARVTVVGTRFRVTALDNGFRVEVAEGHVHVDVGPASSFELLRGQALQVTDGAPGVTSTNEINDFPELEAVPGPHAALAPLPPPAEAAPAPASAAPSVSRAGAASVRELETWRHLALAPGGCGQVVEQAQRAVRENPRQVGVWQVLADCLRRQGADAQAADAYEHVASLAGPEEADRARLLLASELLEKLGQPARAETVLRAYLRRGHPPQLEAAARVSLAKSLVALGRIPEARRELERVTQQRASTPAALDALNLLEKLGAR